MILYYDHQYYERTSPSHKMRFVCNPEATNKSCIKFDTFMYRLYGNWCSSLFIIFVLAVSSNGMDMRKGRYGERFAGLLEVDELISYLRWIYVEIVAPESHYIAPIWKRTKTHTCIRILHTTRQKLDSLITTNWQQRLYWAIFPCHLLFLFLFLLLLNSVRVIETIIAFSFERKE